MNVPESPWRRSDRGDPWALPLADRHYNRQKPGSPQFVPPGHCLVLLTEDRSAVWTTSWPLAEYVKHAWPGAWVNSLFRYERPEDEHPEDEHPEDSPWRASDLIRWAVAHTRAEWPDVPDLGMVTFVDPNKTKRKRDPGRCYRKAGFKPVGHTKGGLVALHLLPDAMPAAEPVPSDQLDLFAVAVTP